MSRLSDQCSPVSMRAAGNACGAVALQWYLRCSSERWVEHCALATYVALFGMRQSKMLGREIDEWKAGFQEGLGNLPDARRILERASLPLAPFVHAISS
jgi:hypothetical protein